MISEGQLSAIYEGATETNIQLFLEPLNTTFEEFNIDTRLRQAAFLAQIGHESGELRFVKEIWGPTPAQMSYEMRRGLGNTEPGDGKRFMGRGLIQVTGRANYRDVGEALELDLIASPELLEEPLYAALSAGWFWKLRGCNVPADMGDMIRLTRIINGGLNGLQDRLSLYRKALDVL